MDYTDRAYDPCEDLTSEQDSDVLVAFLLEALDLGEEEEGFAEPAVIIRALVDACRDGCAHEALEELIDRSHSDAFSRMLSR